MYSWEIEELLKLRNYILESDEYLYICRNSQQLDHIKYNPYEDNFEAWSTDNYYFKFKVKKKNIKESKNGNY